MQTSTSGILSLFSASGSALAPAAPSGEAPTPPAFSGLLQLLLPPNSGETLPTTLPMANLAADLPSDQAAPVVLPPELTTLLAQIAYGQHRLQPTQGPANTSTTTEETDTRFDETEDADALAALALLPPVLTPPTVTAGPNATAVDMSTAPLAEVTLASQAQQFTARNNVQAITPETDAQTPTDLEQATPAEKKPVMPLTLDGKAGSLQVPANSAQAVPAAQLPNAEALTAAVSASVQNIEHNEAKHSLQQLSAVKTPEATTTVMQQANARMDLGMDPKQWGGALTGRIMTMIADDVQEARIHLDPPELGSLEIKLHIQQQQAVVQVQTQHTHVRDVLEANAQRLRDALAEQGVQLSGFDVSHQHQQQHAEQGQGSGAGGYGLEDGGEVWGDTDNTTTPVVQSLNLLDTFV